MKDGKWIRLYDDGGVAFDIVDTTDLITLDVGQGTTSVHEGSLHDERTIDGKRYKVLGLSPLPFEISVWAWVRVE